jgi:hypothetical protein
MNTQLKEEIIDIVSIILGVIAVCCFSYFVVEKAGDEINHYMNSVYQKRPY